MSELPKYPSGDHWVPVPIDAAYLARLRSDYPEHASESDEELLDYFNEDGGKYATLWDHVGDAHSDYEPLADAYFALRAYLSRAMEYAGHLDECDWKIPGFKWGEPVNCTCGLDTFRAFLSKQGVGE